MVASLASCSAGLSDRSASTSGSTPAGADAGAPAVVDGPADVGLAGGALVDDAPDPAPLAQAVKANAIAIDPIPSSPLLTRTTPTPRFESLVTGTRAVLGP